MSGLDLYHYTCDHGRRALDVRGTVLPLGTWNRPVAEKVVDILGLADLPVLSWFTDLATPVPDALGLTRRVYGDICDRTVYRYRVLGGDIMPWVRCSYRRGPLRVLERTPGALPMHWWVAHGPVAVELA